MTCQSLIRRNHSLPACGIALALACLLSAQSPPTGRITGRVLDALGEGVTAARLRLEATIDGKTVTQRSISDADGMFVFSKVPLDSAYGYVRIFAESKGRCTDSDLVDITRSSPEGWSSLRLWDAGVLDVTVVDEQHHPVAGATVIACAHRSRLFGFTPNGKGVSDQDGKVHFTGIPLGGVDVRARADGRPFAEQTLSLGDHGEVEPSLPKGNSVTLRVTIEGLPEGKEARLSIYPYSNGTYQGVPGLAGETLMTKNGRFEADGLPALEYRVSARLGGYASEPSEQQLKPGIAVQEAKFVFRSRGSVQIHGVLRDAQGTALGGVHLRCRASDGSAVGEDSTTDAQGRFNLEAPLAAGQKSVFEVLETNLTLQQVKTDEHYGRSDPRFMGWYEFQMDSSVEYVLTAIPSVLISGHVIDDLGAPLRGRRVELQESAPNRTPTWIAMRYATTNADGAFTFRRVYPLACPLRVSLGALDSAASEIFQVKSGQVISNLVIHAVPRGIVEGRIVDAQGRPQAGMRVWLRNWSTTTGHQTDDRLTEILSSRDGRYCFVDVEPGGHRLETYRAAERAELKSEPFDVDAGATVTRDLKLDQ